LGGTSDALVTRFAIDMDRDEAAYMIRAKSRCLALTSVACIGGVELNVAEK
jgi:hypothetical protein